VNGIHYRNVLLDFDGVLVESNEERTVGFRRILADYPADQVEALIAFHRANGGLSRYAKLRHFFSTIRGEAVEEATIQRLADAFSRTVKQQIVKAPWVSGALEFIKAADDHRLFVVSGSDQAELREILNERAAAHYFVECVGSPVEKLENVLALLKRHRLSPAETVFVGDSRNDFETARAAGIAFIARRSGQEDWSSYPVPVINTLFELRSLV
jgi:HAD superfamily hydrolase (TIGR01549 family)